MNMPFGVSLTIWRAGTVTDDYGDPVAGAYLAHTIIEGCAVEPAPADNGVEPGRSSTSYACQVFAPSGADIAPADRVLLYGRWWQATEDPRVWQSPFTGWAPGVVVRFEAVEG